MMEKTEIEKIVDTAFDQAFSQIQSAVDKELYPAAFANEYSWLRVKKVFSLNNTAIRKAVKDALSAVLSEVS